MKKILTIIMLSLIISLTILSGIVDARSSRTKSSDVYVKGYYRKDGTYVSPHYRSAPDGIKSNNYSCIDYGQDCGTSSVSNTTSNGNSNSSTNTNNTSSYIQIKQDINFRETAGIKGKKIQIIYKGSYISKTWISTIIDGETWYYISYNGKYGRINYIGLEEKVKIDNNIISSCNQDIIIGKQKWSSCNVGAKNINDYGELFQWGINTPGYTENGGNMDTNAWLGTNKRGPCNIGYHVPTWQEWEIAFNNLGNYTNLIDKLKLPFAGEFDKYGYKQMEGHLGNYWTSSPGIGKGAMVSFTKYTEGTKFNYGYNYISYGFSVRCIKD